MRKSKVIMFNTQSTHHIKSLFSQKVRKNLCINELKVMKHIYKALNSKLLHFHKMYSNDVILEML